MPSQTGELIDVYQAATQMTDEVNSGQTYPFTINTLLDQARSEPEGYYGAFVANMHGDGGAASDVKQAQIVAVGAGAQRPGRERRADARLARWPQQLVIRIAGVGRNGRCPSRSRTAPGANGLRGMVPTFAPVRSSRSRGTEIRFAFTLDTIKGVTYAFFDATTGDYVAIYLPDTTVPVISGVSATGQGATAALVTWDTDEGATTRVDYGTSAASLNQNATDNTLVLEHALTLNDLTPNTTYHYRVTSVDFFGNASTFPAPPARRSRFATPPLLQSFLDTTVADFSAGTPDAGALVAQTDDGEVILKPTDGSGVLRNDAAGRLVDRHLWNGSGMSRSPTGSRRP